MQLFKYLTVRDHHLFALETHMLGENLRVESLRVLAAQIVVVRLEDLELLMAGRVRP